MKNTKTKYLHIEYDSAKKLNVTFVESCLLKLIYGLSTHPRNPHYGFCWSSRKTLADHLTMTKRGIQKMIDRLVESKHLIVDEETKYIGVSNSVFQFFIDQEYVVNSVQESDEQNSPGGERSSLGGEQSSSNTNIHTTIDTISSSKEEDSSEKTEESSEEIQFKPVGDGLDDRRKSLYMKEEKIRKERIANAERKECFDFFCQMYELKMKSKYSPRIVEDKAAIKALHATYGKEKLMIFIRKFMVSRDPIVQKMGKTIGTLRSRINNLISTRFGVSPQ